MQVWLLRNWTWRTLRLVQLKSSHGLSANVNKQLRRNGNCFVFNLSWEIPNYVVCKLSWKSPCYHPVRKVSHSWRPHRRNPSSNLGLESPPQHRSHCYRHFEILKLNIFVTSLFCEISSHFDIFLVYISIDWLGMAGTHSGVLFPNNFPLSLLLSSHRRLCLRPQKKWVCVQYFLSSISEIFWRSCWPCVLLRPPKQSAETAIESEDW